MAFTDPTKQVEPSPEEGQTAIVDALAGYVRQMLTEARDHRQACGVEDRLTRALRSLNMEHQPEDADLVKDVDIHMGICALKARAASSWVNDILTNSTDKPFSLRPTPNPDLPDWIKNEIVDILEQEITQLGATDNIRERARGMKEAAHKYVMDRSSKSVNRMERKIEDQLLEAEWPTLFGVFIDDLMWSPTAYMRFPTIQKEKRAVWNGSRIEVKEVEVKRGRRINPFNAYPSPDSGDTQTGDYFIEVYSSSAASLHAAIGLFGFIDENIRVALDRYGSSGYEEYANETDERDELENKNQGIVGSKLIDVLIMNGRLLGEYLIDHGVLVDDPQGYYEAEVWVINDITVKAVLNPHLEDRRPILATSYIKVPGSIWGKSLVELTMPAERMAHAAIRSLVKNMSFSAGPIGEFNAERLADGVDPTISGVQPYKMYPVKDDFSSTGSPVFRFQIIPSIAPQAQAIFEYYLKYADDLSGVPAYVMGSPQVAGAGRTLGGLSMLMGNAAKGIKNVVKNLDRDVIEPGVGYLYDFNMAYDDDREAKGDAQVVARGASGLLQRELAQTRTVELLNLLTPYVQGGAIPPQGIHVLLREVLKNTGLPVDDIIPDPLRAQELSSALGQQGISQAMDRGTSTPVPLPPQSVRPPDEGRTPLNPQFPTPVNMATGA